METFCACVEQEKTENLEKLESIFSRYRGQKGILVDMLHDIQHELGYLPDYALKIAANELGISEAQIYGVATFYSAFHFTPRPKNQIKVCIGTACHVRGAQKLVEELESVFEVKANQPSNNLEVGIETVGCVGCCSLAPVLVVNGIVSKERSAKKIAKKINYKAGSN